MKYVNLSRSGLKVDGIIPPLPDTPPSLTPPSAIQNY